ncbi:lantibiotic dehydratase [Streptomyces sp. RK75]|uniref:lantibiotic dehydratase n=1 Tax=Streptomyces sp. RK75 TaxID=2824895 RepID=UPI001B36709E|nr:lantibiotic dehydratase [Streptomyces sp. RK75]MBQ0864837.1 lantibiotic dehydratase [Streptomyces sp. RK75]
MGIPLGSAALLRLAGVPVDAWCGAGSPEVFGRADELAERQARTASRARALSVRLGNEIVPDDRLTTAGRRAVLALRRRLHAGDLLDVAPATAATGVTGATIPETAETAPESASDAPKARETASEAPQAPDTPQARDTPQAPDAPETAAEAVAVLDPHLARELRELGDDAGVLRASFGAFERAVAAERERVSLALLELARTDPALRGFVEDAAPRAVADLERRAAAGVSWQDKRQRKGVGYLWRALGRTVAKTTPRGWAGQLAALPVCAVADDGPLLPQPRPVGGDVAARRTENVHLLWSRLRELDLSAVGPQTLLAPAPLYHATGVPGTGGLHFCVVDPRPEGGGRLRRLTLRRTPVLEAVLELLGSTPRTVGALEAGLGPPSSRPVLRAFLSHLHCLGVLQICAVPEVRRLSWTPPPATGEHLPLGSPGEGTGAAARGARGSFLDSYRKLGPSAAPGARGKATRPLVGGQGVAAVAEGLAMARRVAALCAADGGQEGSGWEELAEAASLGAEPVSVVRLLDAHHHEYDAAAAKPVPRARYEGWRPVRTPGSGYARLVAHIGARLDAECVDLDATLLDGLGTPRVSPLLEAWPVDCLLRPTAPAPAVCGASAVLESASPAGVLDARFAEALGELHEPYGGYPNPVAHRDFLAAFERRTGVRFVELLVPPLAEAAANAVRRPITTSWCTGDPNTPLYYGRSRESVPGAADRHSRPTPLPPVRHLPLDSVTLRVTDTAEGRALVAEADGVRILPVHHATRLPAPPYDRLLRLLTATGHPATVRMVRLDGLAGAFPEAARVPRLTVGGLLVVSPAQWRVPRAALWRPADPEPVKVAALAGLRRSTGLPRFGYARTRPGAKPLPVDLAALPALQALERLCQAEPGTDLLFEEALPAPNTAERRGVAAQLLLRLPHDRTAEELAERAAAVWREAAISLPGVPLASGGGTEPGRTPHPR